MNCRVCKHTSSHVMRSKPRPDAIRRIRQCDRCGYRWPTLELDEQQVAEDRELLARARKLAASLEPG